MNESKLINAAKVLTTKDVVYINHRNAHQDSENIYVFNVTDIFHEILHFITAKSEDRFRNNLSYEGLENYGYDIPMFQEERLVGHVGLLIIDKYSKPDSVLYKYHEYLANLGNDYDFDEERKLAIERLDSYKKEFNIDPINYLCDIIT